MPADNEIIARLVPEQGVRAELNTYYLYDKIDPQTVIDALGYVPYDATNPAGYEANTIDSISVNGVEQQITNKNVDITVPDSLPPQADNAGKFLTTNGETASWSTDISLPLSFTVAGFSLTQRANFPEVDLYYGETRHTCFSISGVEPGRDNAWGCGSASSRWATVHTAKIRNNFNSLIEANIDVPSVQGKLALQIDALPTAESRYNGIIYQFTGTTDSTYTNGRFYKCVSDGQPTPTYSWEEVQMAETEIPSQTGNSGKFLTTNGTATSWASLATVATTGNYTDLIGKPTIPAAQVNSDWNASSGVAEILNKPNLANVATTGEYDDLLNKPTIPAAQVQTDWNATSGMAEILNKPTLSTVATTGDYTDLINKPTIPDTTNMQVTTNLVTSVSSASTDAQYPSAKLFYDTCGDIETLINAL